MLSYLNKIIVGLLVSVIKLYRLFISPLFPPSCRFTPTCSEYAMESLQKLGPFKGVYKSVVRILKCNPFFKGGYDPVPEKKFKLKM